MCDTVSHTCLTFVIFPTMKGGGEGAAVGQLRRFECLGR